MNLFIFSRNQSENSVLLVPAPFRGSKVNILLKYNRAGGAYHGFDHYEPVLHCSKSSGTSGHLNTNADASHTNLNNSATNFQPCTSSSLPSVPTSPSMQLLSSNPETM